MEAIHKTDANPLSWNLDRIVWLVYMIGFLSLILLENHYSIPFSFANEIILFQYLYNRLLLIKCIYLFTV